MQKQWGMIYALLLLVGFFAILSPAVSYAKTDSVGASSSAATAAPIVNCTPPDSSGNPTNPIDKHVQATRDAWTAQKANIPTNVMGFFRLAAAQNACVQNAVKLYRTFEEAFSGADAFNTRNVLTAIKNAAWKAIYDAAMGVLEDELTTVCQGTMEDFTSLTSICMPGIPGLGAPSFDLPILSGCALSIGNGGGATVSAQDIATFINANSGSASTPIPSSAITSDVNSFIHR